MTVENILLLRVGVDSSTGKAHGTLFEENSFVYLPIPESSDTTETRTYGEFSAPTGRPLSEYAPHLSNRIPHFDPEFETYTYGDPGQNKRRQLARLTENDLLIFYSSLAPQDVQTSARLCVIGYFVVDRAYDLEEMSSEEFEQVQSKLKNNAHIKRTGLTSDSPHRDSYPVIVQGKPNESRLLEKAIPLGDSSRKVLPWVADIIGFDGDLTRAGTARVLDEQNASQIQKWLSDGAETLVDTSAPLRSYIQTSDRGFAPNVTGGYCTLATCKPRIREHAKIGDWILGTPSVNDGPEKLTYLMRVDESMNFDDYYRSERFECKRPQNDPDGDNIYYEEDGVLVQDEETRYHKSAKERKRDLSTDRVLISSTFWYFGANEIAIPESLRHKVIHKYDSDNRRLYSKKGRESLAELIEWCSLRYDMRVNGPVRKDPVSASTGPGC